MFTIPVAVCRIRTNHPESNEGCEVSKFVIDEGDPVSSGQRCLLNNDHKVV